MGTFVQVLREALVSWDQTCEGNVQCLIIVRLLDVRKKSSALTSPVQAFQTTRNLLKPGPLPLTFQDHDRSHRRLLSSTSTRHHFLFALFRTHPSPITNMLYAAVLLAGCLVLGADAQVTLGTAAPFSVLAASAITNTGLTVVQGELGIYPDGASSITGFPPGISGTVHGADAVAKQAQADAQTAFNEAAALASTKALTGQDLGGMTLPPGVYTFSSSAGLTGALTLDGQGNSNAEWVFQIGSTLTTASASSVLLTNGANACNVFWQVGSSATLGTGTTFAGNIIAQASITVTTGCSVDGGLYALTAAVTLDDNQITECQGTTAVSSVSSSIPATTSATAPTTVKTTAPTTAPTTAKTTAPTTVKTTAPTTAPTSKLETSNVRCLSPCSLLSQLQRQQSQVQPRSLSHNRKLCVLGSEPYVTRLTRNSASTTTVTDQQTTTVTDTVSTKYTSCTSTKYSTKTSSYTKTKPTPKCTKNAKRDSPETTTVWHAPETTTVWHTVTHSIPFGNATTGACATGRPEHTTHQNEKRSHPNTKTVWHTVTSTKHSGSPKTVTTGHGATSTKKATYTSTSTHWTTSWTTTSTTHTVTPKCTSARAVRRYERV